MSRVKTIEDSFNDLLVSSDSYIFSWREKKYSVNYWGKLLVIIVLLIEKEDVEYEEQYDNETDDDEENSDVI